MNRLLVALVLAASLTTGTFLLYPEPAEGQGVRVVCNLSLKFQNNYRRITGAQINTECEWPHSPPWGNWGVESKYGRRYDGNQYQGWYPTGGWYQWNSCPVNFNDSEHFNDGRWRQKGRSDRTFTHASTRWPIYGPSGETCRDIADGTVYTESNSYMELWELDKNDGDDRVSKLRFPTLSAHVQCSSDTRCFGRTSWKFPTSGHHKGATARSRFEIRYYR